MQNSTPIETTAQPAKGESSADYRAEIAGTLAIIIPAALLLVLVMWSIADTIRMERNLKESRARREQEREAARRRTEALIEQARQIEIARGQAAATSGALSFAVKKPPFVQQDLVPKQRRLFKLY